MLHYIAKHPNTTGERFPLSQCAVVETGRGQVQLQALNHWNGKRRTHPSFSASVVNAILPRPSTWEEVPFWKSPVYYLVLARRRLTGGPSPQPRFETVVRKLRRFYCHLPPSSHSRSAKTVQTLEPCLLTLPPPPS